MPPTPSQHLNHEWDEKLQKYRPLSKLKIAWDARENARRLLRVKFRDPDARVFGQRVQPCER